MTTQPVSPRGRVLVAGATGYVGARLVPRLAEAGYEVRAMGRSLAKLESRPWAGDPRIELVVADVRDPKTLARAVEDCDAVYYLIHSMERGSGGFEEVDREAAKNMATACAARGVKRIVYLGGLGGEGPDVSRHLRSRAEVAKILGSSGVPVTTLRAAMIIGSGSASFEILRYLTDRLPVMITPRWVSTPVQPIAIRNALGYLVGVLGVPETAGESYDIGGPDVVSYRELMTIYAEEAGLRERKFFPVPVLTPRLSSHWIHFVTGAPAALAKPLAEGLSNPVVTTEDRIRKLVPQELLSCREAIRRAMEVVVDTTESHWSDAGDLPPSAWILAGDPDWTGGSLVKDERSMVVEASPGTVWTVISQIGGRAGWYYANALWHMRGALDTLVGGVGFRRGRPRPKALRAGDVVDFWRVLEVEPERRVRLVAEMRLPGEAVLELGVKQVDDTHSRVSQIAYFRPRGLAGLAYWYALYPVHALIFRGMLRGIAKRAGGPA